MRLPQPLRDAVEAASSEPLTLWELIFRQLSTSDTKDPAKAELDVKNALGRYRQADKTLLKYKEGFGDLMDSWDALGIVKESDGVLVRRYVEGLSTRYSGMALLLSNNALAYPATWKEMHSLAEGWKVEAISKTPATNPSKHTAMVTDLDQESA